MEIKKVNLDRTKLSSAYIQEKQDFSRVLKDVRLTKTPTFKSPWFYGAVVLSSVAVATMILSDFDHQFEEREKKTTHLSSEEKPKKDPVVMASAYSALAPASTAVIEKKSSSKNARLGASSTAEQKKPVDEIVNDVPAMPKVEIAAEKHRSEFPTINGFSSGKLFVSDLLNAEEIEIVENYKIVSYKVQYFNGRSDLSVQMSGSALPKNIREQIAQFNVGQMVFFTEIKGLTSDGKLKLLPSMNFKIVSN